VHGERPIALSEVVGSRGAVARVDHWRARWRAVPRLVQWLPAAGAGAYVALLCLNFQQILVGLYASSDAASPLVIADCLSSPACGHGHVVLADIPYFTTLWLDWLSRPLPDHRLLWQLGPYALALVGFALLGWTAWRLAGRWAAMTSVLLAGAMSAAGRVVGG